MNSTEVLDPLAKRFLSAKSLNVVATVAAVAQFLGLLIFSINRFVHFDTGIDYAIFNQATYLIGHGHLSPYNTIYSDRFWQDQFNLLAWPIGFIRVIFSSSLSLLVIQGGVIAATSFVVMRFVIQSVYSFSYPRWLSLSVVFAVSLLVMVSPWAYEADFFDFHMEPIFTFTLALALYGFWFGKRRLAYAMVAFTLLAAAASSVFVVGMGVGMILLKRLRRSGLVVTAIGVAWFLLASLLNAHQSTNLAVTYGYLAHSSSAAPSLIAILEGVITHPGTPIAVLSARRGPIAQIFEFSGFVGVLFPPAGVATIASILVNGLPNTPAFIALAQGFQNYPEVVLLTMGSVIVVLKLFRVLNGRYAEKVSKDSLGNVLGALTALVSVVLGVVALSIDVTIPPFWLRVSPVVSETLQRYVPAKDVEVIATMNVVGRYASRGSIYAWFGDPQSFPVCTTHQVIVLVANDYTQPVRRSVVLGEVLALEKVQWAKLIETGSQTWIFSLSLPKDSTLTLPGATYQLGLNGLACHNA